MTEKQESLHSIQTFHRMLSYRNADEAFTRLQPLRAGQGEIIRFSAGSRVEHVILILAITGLAISGLVLAFKNNVLAGIILRMLGGLEATQAYHHLLGLMLIGLAIYHLAKVLDIYFVKRLDGSILPEVRDLEHLFQIIRLNLGLSKKLPQYGRYSLDEKFLYWLTLGAGGGLIATGLVMWFPNWVTQVLPGQIFPYSAVFHRWLAFLLVGITILLHGYQVFLRRLNVSIFTGRISQAVMEEDHPVEFAFLQKAADSAGAESWPQAIDFSVDTWHTNESIRPVKEKKEINELTNDVKVKSEADKQVVDVIDEDKAGTNVLEVHDCPEQKNPMSEEIAHP